MATPFPFISGAVLSAAELNSIGEAGANFTATWTNYTRGNGTSVAKEIQINKLVYVYVKETLGTTSSVTGGLQLTLPYTCANVTSIQYVGCGFGDVSALAVYPGIIQSISTTAIQLRAINTAGTYATQTVTSGTIPFTWANTDYFEAAFWYERT